MHRESSYVNKNIQEVKMMVACRVSLESDQNDNCDQGSKE